MRWLELLIVEDEAQTLAFLRRRFQEVFKDALVLWEGTTIEAGQRIIRSRRGRLDAAILDFHLSSERDRAFRIDTSLCGEMRKHSPKAKVFHYTGFSTDHEVVEHFNTFHRGGGFLIYEKLPRTGEAGRLERDVMSNLFSARAESVLLSLIGPVDVRYAPRQPTIGPVSGQDAFLAGLELGIIAEQGWSYLLPDVQEHLRQSTKIQNSGRRARLSLLDTEALSGELSQVRKAGHFELRYHPRRFDFDAVDPELIGTYFAALSSLSQLKSGSTEIPIRVFIHHIGGMFPQHDQSFTDFDLAMQPYIVLPVWPPGTFNSTHALPAMKFAFREASRAISLNIFAPDRPPPRWWWWVDGLAEAESAMFLDDCLGPESNTPLADSDSPLDQSSQTKEAALFIEFLKLSHLESFPGLIEEVTRRAPRFHTPWDALEALLGENFEYGVDIFADFARHSYFRDEPRSYLSHREGCRQLPRIHDLDREPAVQFNGCLDHLSRIYYQFETASTDGALDVFVVTTSHAASRSLRIELCPQDDAGRWSKIYLFQTDPILPLASDSTWRHESISLEEETTGGPARKWILILSNCGVDERLDAIEFAITARLSRVSATTGGQ